MSKQLENRVAELERHNEFLLSVLMKHSTNFANAYRSALEPEPDKGPPVTPVDELHWVPKDLRALKVIKGFKSHDAAERFLRMAEGQFKVPLRKWRDLDAALSVLPTKVHLAVRAAMNHLSMNGEVHLSGGQGQGHG